MVRIYNDCAVALPHSSGEAATLGAALILDLQ
jgi:hypothetical protein